jgi:uncharacterized heparinase superfamily protein
MKRSARFLMSRLQNLRPGSIPDAPSVNLYDLWRGRGDAERGAKLAKGKLEFLGASLPMPEGVFAAANGSLMLRAYLHSFVWLRDLSAFGNDAARARARAVVLDYMETEKLDPAGTTPDVTGARLAAWLVNYEFFAASADDDFRQHLMGRLVIDARNLAAELPAELLDGRALTALKGLAAASVALPDHADYLARVFKFLVPELERQILPDGVHCERSPAAHLAALQDLIEIRVLCQAAQIEAPPELLAGIEKMAAALRALRHGDGALALFNGSREDLAGIVDMVLAQTGRAKTATATLGSSGFQRLSAGKALLLADAGAPAPLGLDRFAHAGTLSFEFSWGRERLIVNCGAAPANAGEWRDMLRSTAAHSTLTISDTSSATILETGLARRPQNVQAYRAEVKGGEGLEMSHDGWLDSFNAIHHRRLWLAGTGTDLRGEDRIESHRSQSFAIRFHLHPGVTASLQQDEGGILLRLPSGQGFKFRAAGAKLGIEESVYFGHAEPRRSEQLVLNGLAGGPQTVKWALTRIG